MDILINLVLFAMMVGNRLGHTDHETVVRSCHAVRRFQSAFRTFVCDPRCGRRGLHRSSRWRRHIDRAAARQQWLSTSREEKIPSRFSPVPLLVVVITGIVLVYGTLDMPDFGSATSPAQTHVAAEYLARTPQDTGVPNVVTSDPCKLPGLRYVW